MLAGGQSLIQAMKLRLSQSAGLVDLGGGADLKAISADANGVTIGAMATHASVASNADVKRVLVRGGVYLYPDDARPGAVPIAWGLNVFPLHLK